MTMLEYRVEYDFPRTKKALEILIVDRKNEFKELAEVLFWNIPASMNPIKGWEEFVMNFCLDVNSAYKSWSGKEELIPNSDKKALTIMRQLSRNKSVNDMTHLLTIANNLAEEFNTIYWGLR